MTYHCLRCRTFMPAQAARGSDPDYCDACQPASSQLPFPFPPHPDLSEKPTKPRKRRAKPKKD